MADTFMQITSIERIVVHENIRIGRNILVGTFYEHVIDVIQNILTYH